MRSLLVKSGIIIFIVLAVGSGLTLAAASSEPGMFLYPIKQTTQKFTRATGGPVAPTTPVMELPQESTSQQPSDNVDTAFEDVQEGLAEEPDITEPRQVNKAAATPVRIVDEITATVGPGVVPNGGSEVIENMSSSPVVDQLSSGYVDDSRNNDGREGATIGDLGDGKADEERSDNDNSHSESGHDDANDEEEEEDDNDD
jgi:hypothetical protein